MRNSIFVLLATVGLVACKPDVDVKLSTSDLVQVASTEQSMMVEFDARIEDKYTKVDDEKKTEVEAIARIIKQYFEGAEVDVSYGGSGFEIEIEGELELVSTGSSTRSPWYFQVLDFGEGEYLVQQRKSDIWNKFEDELKAVSFMAKPDSFLPLNIKLKNDGGTILVGGAILDGEYLTGFERVKLTGSRVNLSFEGDHWKKAAAAFLFIEPK